MSDLARKAHLLNRLRDRREELESFLLRKSSAISLANLRRMKAEYAACVRRIARLEAKLR